MSSWPSDRRHSYFWIATLKSIQRVGSYARQTLSACSFSLVPSHNRFRYLVSETPASSSCCERSIEIFHMYGKYSIATSRDQVRVENKFKLKKSGCAGIAGSDAGFRPMVRLSVTRHEVTGSPQGYPHRRCRSSAPRHSARCRFNPINEVYDSSGIPSRTARIWTIG